MQLTIRELMHRLDRLAPFSLQEDWDNSGLMIGSYDAGCSGLYLDLDLTSDTVRAAKEAGVNTVVTHHPILFTPLSVVSTDQPPGSILREALAAGLQVIAMHTNLDHATGGVNDALAVLLEIEEARPIEDDIGRVADTKETTADAWVHLVKKKLRVQPRYTGDPNKIIRRVGWCGGAGGDLAQKAASLGLDLLITSEIKHHQMLLAKETGLFLIDAGHYETEYPVLGALAAALETIVDLPVHIAPFVPPYHSLQGTEA